MINKFRPPRGNINLERSSAICKAAMERSATAVSQPVRIRMPVQGQFAIVQQQPQQQQQQPGAAVRLQLPTAPMQVIQTAVSSAAVTTPGQVPPPRPAAGSIVVVNNGAQQPQQIIRLASPAQPRVSVTASAPMTIGGGSVTVTAQPQPILIPVGGGGQQQQQQQQPQQQQGQPDKIFVANHPTAGQILVRKWSPSPSPSPPGAPPQSGVTTVSRLIPVSGPPPPGARIATLRQVAAAPPGSPAGLRPQLQVSVRPRLIVPSSTSAGTALNQNTPIPTTLSLPQVPVSAAELSASTAAAVTLPSQPVRSEVLFQKPLPPPASSPGSPVNVQRLLANASPVRIVPSSPSPQPQPRSPLVNTPLPKEIRLPSEPLPMDRMQGVDAKDASNSGEIQKETRKKSFNYLLFSLYNYLESRILCQLAFSYSVHVHVTYSVLQSFISTGGEKVLLYRLSISRCIFRKWNLLIMCRPDNGINIPPLFNRKLGANSGG